jgi:TolB-like protein
MTTEPEVWKSDGLTPEQELLVRQHLVEVAASAAFAGSRRATDFLLLVVAHALAGDFEALRERMIGAEMFGRPIDYDTGSDSVVRVKATEVRRKLAQFYSEKTNPTVRIELPSGSYVPRFGFALTGPSAHSIVGASAPPIGETALIVDPDLTSGDAEAPAAESADSEVKTQGIWHYVRDKSRILLSRRFGAWVGLGLLLLGVGYGLKRWLVDTRETTLIHSVAVLPLENHSGVPAQEYFADGMTKELVTDLAQMSSLRVTPVATVMNYKGTGKSPGEIAHELSVDGVVQGTVLREGNFVLITVRLTNAKTNHVIWMHAYVRDLKTELVWQGEVAQTIAKEINLGVAPDKQVRFRQDRPVDSVAQDLYLHGMYLLEAEDCTNAADFFRAAINVSFAYPQAQASLAFCDGHLGETDRVDSVDAFSMQKIEAATAAELDDSLADGHAELANAAINLNWDWATAATEFRRALQLSPKSASIHEEYERYLLRIGRVREATAEIQRNEDMDPFSSRLYHLEGSIFYYCRQYDQALLLIDKVRTLDIPSPNWHFLLGEIYAEKGKYADSIAEFSRAGSRPQAVGHLGNTYARAGKVDDAMAQIPHLEESVKNEGIGRYEIAIVYAGLGKKEEAFKWLEEAYKARDEGLTYLKIDPCLDPLRSDPRFDDLLSRIGLAQ